MSEEEIGQEIDRVIRAASMALGQLREHTSRKQAERDAATRTQYDEQRRVLQQRMGELHEAVRSPDFWATANGERVANTVDVIVAAGPDVPHGQNMYDTVRGNLERRYGIDLDELRTTHAGDASGRRRALIDAVDDAVAARKQSADADTGTADDLASEAAVVGSPEKHADLADGSEQALTSANLESQDGNALQAGADATATAAIPADQSAASTVAQVPGGVPATSAAAAGAVSAVPAVTRPLTAAQQARATVDASYPMTVRESLTSAAATGQVKPQRTAAALRNRQREATRTR
ncbi:hypothetical protein [Curtobacterium sp. MCPF17_021]|uniref:hypothetical protein n=1 Tax=Curtobacterium sp. MCPF17_021 TaxID=2175639 RepID=UPI000DAAABD6|nr:hypothetical protein [Curtobacterium sp. MCPF17_021]WIE85143.1 hypothetical protein DEJ29_018125 [Curtobacterium sp. MCPF17_021]